MTENAVTDFRQDAAALASIRRALARLLMRHAGSDRAVTLLRGADKCVRALAVLLGDPAFGKEPAK